MVFSCTVDCVELESKLDHALIVELRLDMSADTFRKTKEGISRGQKFAGALQFYAEETGNPVTFVLDGALTLAVARNVQEEARSFLPSKKFPGFRSVYALITPFMAPAPIMIVKSCAEAHEDFGYRGSKGPQYWADGLHYGMCAGKLQSPIDIEEHKVKPVRLAPLVFSGFHSVPRSMVLTNNGHTVKLEIQTSTLATLSGGPLSGPYVFSQLHFHWGANDSVGSEDLINNHSFPMELHMVFYKQEYGDPETATKYKDGLCVLAVFYDAYEFDNSVYSEIVEHLGSVTRPNSQKALRAPMTLDDLLPSNKHHYYTYNGSLTTPPCYEVVTWLDFKEPIPLSHFQIAEFRKLRSSEGELTENFRPTQPLGNRTVLYNVGERPVGWKRHRDYEPGDYQNGSGVRMTWTSSLLSILFLLLR